MKTNWLNSERAANKDVFTFDKMLMSSIINNASLMKLRQLKDSFPSYTVLRANVMQDSIRQSRLKRLFIAQS